MISVKCPACGLVDWNVGDCKRCGQPLAGVSAEYDGEGYAPGVSEWAAEARSVRTARRVMAACAVVVLALTALGALYLAHRPTQRQWFWSFYRNEPTVAEIFAHHLEVSGGAVRLAGLRGLRGEGRMTFSGGEAAQTAGASATFVMHVKAPDKTEMAVEMEPSKSSDEPQTNVSLRRGFDGTRGWEYVERSTLAPGSTVPVKQYSSRELSGDELERMKHSTRGLGLSRLSDEYASLKLTGRERVTWATQGSVVVAGRTLPDLALRGHEAYVLSGVNREGRNETLYFDTETGLLLRVDFEAEDGGGEPFKVECHFGDYREVGGLKFPHRLIFNRGEESVTLTFEKYLPNDPIPDSTFAPPE